MEKRDGAVQEAVTGDADGAHEDTGTVDVDATDGGDQGGGPDVCQLTCEGKQCGDDGCGGSCGTCPDLEVIPPNLSTVTQGCGADGQCHCARCIYVYFGKPWSCEGDCNIMFDVPDCTGKECGPDGFGGSCGKCGWGAECGPKGQCVCAFP